MSALDSPAWTYHHFLKQVTLVDIFTFLNSASVSKCNSHSANWAGIYSCISSSEGCWILEAQGRLIFWNARPWICRNTLCCLLVVLCINYSEPLRVGWRGSNTWKLSSKNKGFSLEIKALDVSMRFLNVMVSEKKVTAHFAWCQS